MAEFKILTEGQIEEKLSDLTDWRVEDSQLKADFTFKDFQQAFSFISMIAIQSDKVDHHPEWSNAYNKVSFAFCTHDAGNKITDLDTDMANFISKSAEIFIK